MVRLSGLFTYDRKRKLIIGVAGALGVMSFWPEFDFFSWHIGAVTVRMLLGALAFYGAFLAYNNKLMG